MNCLSAAPGSPISQPPSRGSKNLCAASRLHRDLHDAIAASVVPPESHRDDWADACDGPHGPSHRVPPVRYYWDADQFPHITCRGGQFPYKD